MSNKVRRNVAVKTEVSSANVAQIQRTTTTMLTTTRRTTDKYTGTTMMMTTTTTTTPTTFKTPLSTTTMTPTTATTTRKITTRHEIETKPETSTQETKNAKYSTDMQKNGLMANQGSSVGISQQQPLQQHVINVTYNNNNDNDDIVNKTNSKQKNQYVGKLKYSYLLQPDEHNVEEYSSNKQKLKGNNEQIEYRHQQQQQQEEEEEAAAAANATLDDIEKDEDEEEEDEEMMEKTQCLDYLGDSLETSPLHLCSLKAPGQLVSRLRTLRLRHCCERNVFSALHTIALNATLSGGVECVRILMDIIDLDALATRITCEYAEILFRFDCRQVYSLIHQCHDCKEAYRRWVCSTLVPFFAEPSDVITPIYNMSSNTTATTSNYAPSNIIHDHKGNTTGKRRSQRNVLAGGHNKNCLNQNQKSVFEDVLDYYALQTNYSISTANNDPLTRTDSVISRVNKRTKRRIEFRRRKRIRPCLSVCQTVEQLCPYLLPADRAPAMPTQYAGEPTFLCLDLNIPEVAAQKESSINGRPDCCYTYCGNVASGICVQCDAFAWSVLNSYDALDGPNITKRVHNVNLTANNPTPQDSFKQLKLNASNALSARISIALRNDSDTAISQRAMESLSYYAYYDGIYYYDDELQDMPYQAISGNCETVPSVTGRCTVPYYAAAHTTKPQCRLLWASLLLCCLYNAYMTAYQQHQRLKYHKKLPNNNNIEVTCKSCQNWEIMSVVVSTELGTLHRQNSKLQLYRGNYYKEYIIKIIIIIIIIMIRQKSHHITIECFMQKCNNNTLTYKSCKTKKINNNNNLQISGRPKNHSKRNKYFFYKFQLFHYINFNINDWWRRWCEFTYTILIL